MPVSIATWNINSVRLRLGLVLDFLRQHGPDVLMLQEIKCTNDQFPTEAFAAAGYSHQAVHGQKGYHGVATLSRFPLTDVSRRAFCEIPDSRHVSAMLDFGRGPVTVHNFYIPAGGDEPDPVLNPKFRHKLDFLSELETWFCEPLFARGHIIAGDFNVAPHENDVWSHKQLLNVVSHTPTETEALDRLLTGGGGWVDLVRKHIPHDQKLYSWWSYRAKDWEASDRGRRLDHIWSTPDIAAFTSGAEIIKPARGWSEKPSDHVPVIVHFA
ncbi:exodeoxyribonuclease III [Arsenicitalea aurantiaca]|uniref:Exodeoxyribonuclease III n=1 Tax=Arsenicitalea aurantiaca TaxID=1783274 RepID=A0A433X7U8_9HYPH|nr:exodeoxyribonuclease III [Arsenicitalea aurantiaca]RUT30135.1 exodeoxyribonuclease III [Arsenicitalea aurantiaca]